MGTHAPHSASLKQRHKSTFSAEVCACGIAAVRWDRDHADVPADQAHPCRPGRHNHRELHCSLILLFSSSFSSSAAAAALPLYLHHSARMSLILLVSPSILLLYSVSFCLGPHASFPVSRARAVPSPPNPLTAQIRLLYANRTQADILLKAELAELGEHHSVPGSAPSSHSLAMAHRAHALGCRGQAPRPAAGALRPRTLSDQDDARGKLGGESTHARPGDRSSHSNPTPLPVCGTHHAPIRRSPFSFFTALHIPNGTADRPFPGRCTQAGQPRTTSKGSCPASMSRR